MTDPETGLSPALTIALQTFNVFLLPDDAERERAISESDPETLRALADAVEPLYPEINAVLDRFDATKHPLPGDQEHLEVDLHALAQAGIEARMELVDKVDHPG